MSPATKAIVIRALESRSSCASDNLYRARRQFANTTGDDMGKQYGESGRTCRQVLDEYEAEASAVAAALAEVKALP